MSPVPSDDAGNAARSLPCPAPQAPQPPPPPVVLALPPIALHELKPPTKAYLMARAGLSGRTPREAIKELLDQAAGRAGFVSNNSKPPHAREGGPAPR